MRKQKSLVLLLIFAMALSLLPQSAFAAKKKVKLNKKTVTVNVGKTVKIKLQNNKKKVKWTVTSGKKNLKLSKKKKTGVTIKGMKAGKAKVQAKVGKKKYVCKVTVKKKQANTNSDKSSDKNTNKSTPNTMTNLSTPTPKPTKEPVQTMTPPDATPTPERKHEGVYAESRELMLSSIKFDKPVEYYSLSWWDIYVAVPEGKTLKDVVPDIKKCDYTVYSYSKKAQVKAVKDVVWHEEPYNEGGSDSGYYTFAIEAEQGGKQYSQTYTMMEYSASKPTCLNNGLVYSALMINGKKYELEESIYPEHTSEVPEQHIFFPKSKDVKFEDLKNVKDCKALVVYEDTEYTISCQFDEYDNENGQRIAFRSDELQIGNLIIGTGNDHIIIHEYNQDDFTFDFTLPIGEGEVFYYDFANLFKYEEQLQKGKTLKDIFKNPAQDLKIYRAIYCNKYISDIKISNIIWHEEPYYSSGCDGGYYSFDVSITVDGKTITKQLLLIEREKKYTVSGILKAQDGQPIANATLDVYRNESYYEEEVSTDEEGRYSFEAADGTYRFEVGSSFVVNGEAIENDMTLPVYRLNGTVSRRAGTTDNWNFWFAGKTENKVVSFHVDEKNNYVAYLEKGTYDLKTETFSETFEVTGSGTKDFVVDLVKVSGKFSKDYIQFVDNENNVFYTMTNSGTYSIYLSPGTYQVMYNNIVFDTLNVTSNDIVKDFVPITCKGKILDASGIEIPQSKCDYDIEIKKDGKSYGTLKVSKYAQIKKDGYEIILPKGTYEFYYQGNSLGSVTIADKDVEKDLRMPVKYVKIQLLDKSGNVISVNSGFDITNKVTNKTYYYDINLEGDVYKEGSILLPLGTYKLDLDGIRGINMGAKEFEVTKDPDVIQIQGDVYKVSGECEINGIKDGLIKELDVYFNSVGSSTIYSYMKENKYECYLKPGDYTITISGRIGNMRDVVLGTEKIKVTSSSVEKNLISNVGSLSGKLAWKDGSGVEINDDIWEKSLRLQGDNTNIYGDTSKKGEFQFSCVPYGKYTLMYGSYEVAEVTLDSATKEHSYTIDGYQITAVLKDTDGQIVKDTNIYFNNLNDTESPVYSITSDSENGSVSIIVKETGVYEVYGYPDAEKVSFGTVTVTDKNIECTLKQVPTYKVTGKLETADGTLLGENEVYIRNKVTSKKQTYYLNQSDGVITGKFEPGTYEVIYDDGNVERFWCEFEVTDHDLVGNFKSNTYYQLAGTFSAYGKKVTEEGELYFTQGEDDEVTVSYDDTGTFSELISKGKYDVYWHNSDEWCREKIASLDISKIDDCKKMKLAQPYKIIYAQSVSAVSKSDKGDTDAETDGDTIKFAADKTMNAIDIRNYLEDKDITLTDYAGVVVDYQVVDEDEKEAAIEDDCEFAKISLASSSDLNGFSDGTVGTYMVDEDSTERKSSGSVCLSFDGKRKKSINNIAGINVQFHKLPKGAHIEITKIGLIPQDVMSVTFDESAEAVTLPDEISVVLSADNETEGTKGKDYRSDVSFDETDGSVSFVNNKDEYNAGMMFGLAAGVEGLETGAALDLSQYRYIKMEVEVEEDLDVVVKLQKKTSSIWNATNSGYFYPVNAGGKQTIYIDRDGIDSDRENCDDIAAIQVSTKKLGKKIKIYGLSLCKEMGE